MAAAPLMRTQLGASAGAAQLSLSERAPGLAALATRPTSLSLAPKEALPAPLAPRPDSTHLFGPVRRWSVLALVGPTLSYRTIGTAAVAGQPDFAHLERPAVGLGAQVQVRRVLSGRWALAAGVGYHEYATRLALQVIDTLHLSQRDTYRLLTLPVQLSYALGAPHGRRAYGLLVGAEPGRYLGGRSTEASPSGSGQQQPYTAANSPYRPWSLALSLGLDLRYHLGGPASRWQWVVQATGRYVLTPFAAPDSARFAPRHPFSVGVSTGISWDIR